MDNLTVISIAALLLLLALNAGILYHLRHKTAVVKPSDTTVSNLDTGKQTQQTPVSNLDTAYAGMDLSGTPRATYCLTLRDGQTLHLRTPTKAVADSFERIGTILQRVGHGRQTALDEHELYLLASKILSHNTAALQIDARKVMDDLTLAELTELLSDYMSWLTEVISSKN